jgi:flagellar basal-body rod modification protein FlgD
MASVAQVVDGKIVNNGVSAAEKEASSEPKKTTGGGSLGKDAFLQLLVAQMKYQDPLAASNNSTEYISQLATFSELESMQNLQEISEQQRMQALVGKTVVLEVDGKQTTGQVDYLQYEDGKAKMSVAGSLYSMEDLYQVIDGEYLTAYTEASNFISKLYRLPTVENLTKKDAEIVHELEDAYENMSEYGKSFIAKEAIEFLDSLGPRAEVLSPRKEEVDYDKLAVEKLDQLIGALGGLTDNKDKITQVLDKILGAGVQSPEDKDDVEENTDKVPDDESGEA